MQKIVHKTDEGVHFIVDKTKKVNFFYLKNQILNLETNESMESAPNKKEEAEKEKNDIKIEKVEINLETEKINPNNNNFELINKQDANEANIQKDRK